MGGVTDAQQIQADLLQAVDDREEKAQLVRRLEGSDPQLADLDGRLEELRERLDKETADVARLESFSAARIWARLRGSHQGDLERETAERGAARYAVAETEARRETLLRERAALESRIRDLWNAEVRYHAAMEAKEAWLVESGDPAAAELAELAERRGELAALDRTTRAALAAGNTAEELLGHAKEGLLGLAGLLAGASSTWEPSGGVGLQADMLKHERTQRAAQTLRRVDTALLSFSHALADVDMPGVDGVEVDQLVRSFHVWFDSVFSSMADRSRFTEAGKRVEGASRQVRHALDELRPRSRDLERQLAELDARRERLLLG